MIGMTKRTQSDLVQERFTRTAAQFATFSRAVRAAEATQLLEMARPLVGGAEAMRTFRALDVACGPGTFTLVFAPHVRRMTGLDITAAILEKARAAAAKENIGNVEWLLGNAEKLPWNDNSFDLVTTAYSLHHMEHAAQAVAEIARVLKPGGWFALVDIAVPEGFDAQVNNAIEIARDASHVRTFTGAELQELARAAGLRVAAEEPGARPRSFDDWMQIAGWKRGDAAYVETRRLMEQNIPHDRSGFAPSCPSDAPDADLDWVQASCFLGGAETVTPASRRWVHFAYLRGQKHRRGRRRNVKYSDVPIRSRVRATRPLCGGGRSMETTMAAADVPQQEISDIGRVIGVLTSPGKTFADIVKKPKWVTPILISSVLGLIFGFVMNQRVDWKAFIRQQIEQSPRGQNIPPERLGPIVETQAKFSKIITYCIGGIGPILGAALLGAIYLFAFNVMGGAGTNFKTAMSIVAHANMTGLVFAPLTIIVMLLRQYGDVDPQNMIATSLYSFLPEGAPRWLQSVGNSVELFWFWTMILLAIGFAATNRKRISTGKAFAFICGIWVVWVFVKASAAALFS